LAAVLHINESNEAGNSKRMFTSDIDAFEENLHWASSRREYLTDGFFMDLLRIMGFTSVFVFFGCIGFCAYLQSSGVVCVVWLRMQFLVCVSMTPSCSVNGATTYFKNI